MSETSPRGRFVWYDLMTTDPNGAADFYTKVAGGYLTRAFPAGTDR